jgi:hypothetical protein
VADNIPLQINIPPAPDVPWVDAQYPFDGEWLPDVDPALIGPRNFANIENLRYNDRSIEGVNGYTRINNTTDISDGDSYDYIAAGWQLRTDPNKSPNSFILVRTEDSSGNGRIYLHTGTLYSDSDFEYTKNLDWTNGTPLSVRPYWTDPSANLDGRFSDAPQNSIVYCNGEENAIFSGYEHRIAAAFLVQDVPTIADAKYPKDVSDELGSSSNLAGRTVTFDATYEKLLVLTTRPIQAMKIYVETASTDGTADIIVSTWNGSDFTTEICCKTSTATGSDGTASGDQTLQATGIVSFDDHYRNISKPFHFEELYLYAYLIQFENQTTNVDAEISYITIDPAMQPISNVWDGVYRQPIQYQIEDNSVAANSFSDYTLHVNQSSDVLAPVGADLSAIGAANDEVIIMFEEQMTAFRAIMLGNLINKNAVTISTLKYWDGDSWESLTFNDGTLDTGGTKTHAKSGLISWTPPSDEQPQTLFGSVGYAYQIVFSGALSGTAGNQDVIVDLIVGVPALLEEVRPFDFGCLYQNRLMLGSYSKGGEGNRMDYSVTNAPDVFNGIESSSDGTQALYYGGVEPITCATQLYNRFGASVFSMLLVFKKTEVYLLVGDGPRDFTIYPVSITVGCPAPQTLAVAEVGLEVGQGLTRNVAIWLSHYGPMMFDGAILQPLTGINNFFDPNETEYIEWANIDKARGWVDQTYKEYNLLIPSTSGQATNNLWLVYDLLRKKWFKKNTGVEEFPQAAWNVMDPSTGEQANYGGIDDGTMIHLEKGTSWNATYADETIGSVITQKLRTGDFFPSNNIWDETLIRKFKIICKKLTGSISVNSHNLNINYYGDAANEAANVIFQDADTASGVYVDFEDMDVDGDAVYETIWQSAAAAVLDLSMNVGLDRVVRLIQDMNEKGWAHSFEFEVATDDVDKGWQPIIWGIQYRVERKDNTSTVNDT